MSAVGIALNSSTKDLRARHKEMKAVSFSQRALEIGPNP
jgi:hypothetical protein